MAETGVIVLDDFADGGTKWGFVGDAGTAISVGRSVTRAGTALGNTAGRATLGYAFSLPAGKGDASLLLTLPAPVDVSSASLLCLDLFVEPGMAANVTRLAWSVRTATGNTSNAGPSSVYDGGWAYFRQPLASFTLGSGTALDWTRVTGLALTLQVAAGTRGTVEVDTIRACSYVYGDDDFRYYGRDPGAATPGTIEAALPAVQEYLFGSTTATAMSAGGYQTDPAQPIYGAVTGWNQWTGQPAEIGLGNDSDASFTSGLALVGLANLYRMTANAAYLTQASFVVQQYFERWYSTEPNGSVGFLPYWVNRQGVRDNQTSTDQYLAATWGLLEYFIVTGRSDQRIVQMLRDFQSWWNSSGHLAFDGSGPANQGAKSSLTDAAVAFATSGDSTSADTNLGSDVSGPSYQAGAYPYQTSWLGSGNSFFGTYSVFGWAIDLLRNRLRRSKVSFPIGAVQTILQQNLLFALGFGSNNYYATDLPGDFGKRPLGWSPTENAASWNGTTKTLIVTASGPNDAMAFDVGMAAYAGPVLLENGGDVTGLIAAGSSTSQTALGVVQAVLGLAVKNAISAPGSPANGAIPAAALGPWQVYHNQLFSSLMARRGILIDEQTNHPFLAAYAYWFLLTRFGGLWPSGGYDRVLDWAYQPATGTLRLTANGTVGDLVTIPITGMQAGQQYLLHNLTVGSQTLAVGGGVYQLSWTLRHFEESWLIGNVVQPPDVTFVSPVGKVLASPWAGGVVGNAVMTRFG